MCDAIFVCAMQTCAHCFFLKPTKYAFLYTIFIQSSAQPFYPQLFLNYYAYIFYCSYSNLWSEKEGLHWTKACFHLPFQNKYTLCEIVCNLSSIFYIVSMYMVNKHIDRHMNPSERAYLRKANLLTHRSGLIYPLVYSSPLF